MNTSKLGDNQVVSVKQERKINSGCRNKLVYACLRKKMKLQRDVIGSGFSPFPFDWSNVPRRLRTKRKGKFHGKETLSRPKEALSKPNEELSEPKKALSRPKEKLDSGVFDIYLKKIWKICSEDRKRHFMYFDSLWFSLYRTALSKDKVLTWIKKEHIFSKAYVFVPIVCWGHWSLLILCHFGESLQLTTRSRCMLLLDSLEMANPRRLEPEIRRFVLDIYKTADRPETKHLVSQIPFLVPKVPQQRDGNECGFFVLYFINLFLELAPDNFSMEGYPYFMKKDWFTFNCLDSFYERLDSLN
ncbi:probable ubiquitin-like-specific protease 2A isoform X1 [Cajanus cajan]|nr:probable ubiquitin-like-specific protease 2A isoform X1 [Cajanus cajan]